MSVALSFIAGAGWQFFDNNGVPLAGGKLFVYNAGTTTKATTYTSSAGSTQNTNPIVLDAAGRVANEIWLTTGALYKFVLSPSTDTDPPTAAIWTKDDIPAINDTTNVLGELANTSDNAKGDALVGFKQSNASGFLSGAVARTVNAKLQELVSVADFGATGDGVTDDTSAVQAAITAAQDSIGVLYVPAGTYIISTVTISGNLILTGSGTPSIFKQKGATVGNMINITGTGNNVVIENMTFDGNYTAQAAASLNSIIESTADGASFTDVFSLIVQNCEFRNPAYASIRVIGDNTFTTRELVWITDNKFIDGAEGIDNPSNDYNPRDIALDDAVEAWVENNLFDSTNAPSYGRSAIIVAQTQTTTERFTEANIIGNRINRRGCNTSQALGAIDLYIWATNCVVRDNVIKNSIQSAIKWKQNGASLRVVNNSISTALIANVSAINGNAPTYAPARDNCLIDGNQIQEWNAGTSYVIALGGVFAATSDYSDGLMIINNQLKNTAGNQIFAFDTQNVGIINNQIFPTTTAIVGLFVDPRNYGAIRIKDNYIGPCSSYSVYVVNATSTTEPDVMFEGNYIAGSAQSYAVYMRGRYINISNNMMINVVNGYTCDNIDYLCMTGNQVKDISGTVAFFINNVTYVLATGNEAYNITTPISYNTAPTVKRDVGNTWNWATAAPTSGRYAVGDVVYNSAPAAGGTIGWVCTTAGTPGTWKTFGAISA